MPELAVIIVVALVVLGPKRLPEIARSLGKGLAEFRRLTGDVNRELDAARRIIEDEARDHERTRRASEQAENEITGSETSVAAPSPETAEDDGATQDEHSSETVEPEDR